MKKDRALHLYLPIAGFNMGQMQNLVISKPVLEYVDGLFIDQYSALELGVSGLRSALRIQRRDDQEGRDQPHDLKIALEFPTPSFDNGRAFQLLCSMVNELKLDSVLFTSPNDAEWIEGASAGLRDVRVKPFVRNGNLEQFESVAAKKGVRIRFDGNLVPKSYRVTSPSYTTLESIAQDHPNGARNLILLSDIVNPYNVEQHEAELRTCREEIDGAIPS